MRKAGKVSLIIIAAIVGLSVIISIFGTTGMDEVGEYKIPDIDMCKIEDGEYEGSSNISRWAVTVKVTVKNHIITDVIITDKKISNITDQLKAEYDQNIIEKEQPVFDTVSGATSVTGKAYIIAVTDALEKAEESCFDCFS